MTTPANQASLLAEPLQPGARVGNYRIVRLLGKGGMGAVYEAVHLYIERRAAIKVLHAQLSHKNELRTRFLNEARAVNLIKHPGLVEIFEFGLLDDGTAYIVMEFLQGESLEEHIKRHPQGLGNAALPIVFEIAQAMVAAHQKGIVHRDLKPANVMLVTAEDGAGKQSDRRLRILDFGIAKMSQEVEGSLRTETGATIGTPAYMAPEQCLAVPNVDGKADVYALGVILYELLSGRLPFLAQHSFDFMAAHVRSEPQPILNLLPDLPPEVANLVHSMLVKDPLLRPSMEVVATLLQELQAAGQALWLSDPHSGAAPDAAAGQDTEHGATLAQSPSRPVRHSKELMEISATAPGLFGGRISRELAQISATPSSQISSNARSSARSSQGAEGSAQRANKPTMDEASSVQPATTPQPSPPTAAQGAAPQRRNTFAFVALLSLLALLAGFALLAGRSHKSSSPESTAASGNRPADVARTVKWQLRTQPAGAEVVRGDGQVIGSTPFQLIRPADKGESPITLRLRGYQSKTLLLSHNTDVETDIVLQGEPPQRPEPTPDTPIGPDKPEEPRKPAAKTGGKRGRKNDKNKANADRDGVKLLMD